MDLSPYPAENRSIYLYNFTNNSFQPDVNVELTDWVRREIDRRENFIPVSEKEKARFWLYGEVTVYRKEGRMYDAYRTPIRYELIIVCKVQLRKNPAFAGNGAGISDEILLTEEIDASGEFSDQEGYIESELSARSRVLRVLASSINHAVDAAFVANAGPPPAKEDQKK